MHALKHPHSYLKRGKGERRKKIMGILVKRFNECTPHTKMFLTMVHRIEQRVWGIYDTCRKKHTYEFCSHFYKVEIQVQNYWRILPLYIYIYSNHLECHLIWLIHSLLTIYNIIRKFIWEKNPPTYKYKSCEK